MTLAILALPFVLFVWFKLGFLDLLKVLVIMAVGLLGIAIGVMLLNSYLYPSL